MSSSEIACCNGIPDTSDTDIDMVESVVAVMWYEYPDGWQKIKKLPIDGIDWPRPGHCSKDAVGIMFEDQIEEMNLKPYDPKNNKEPGFKVEVIRPVKQCLICLENGHHAQDCPNDDTNEDTLCEMCHKKGHNTFKCPDRLEGKWKKAKTSGEKKTHICLYSYSDTKECTMLPEFGYCIFCASSTHKSDDCPKMDELDRLEAEGKCDKSGDIRASGLLEENEEDEAAIGARYVASLKM